MLALLLFPLGNNTLHQFKHLEEEHCLILGTHYCATEHNCEQCDYVFSTSALLTEHFNEINLLLLPQEDFATCFVSPVLRAHYFCSLSRGPPTC